MEEVEEDDDYFYYHFESPEVTQSDIKIRILQMTSQLVDFFQEEELDTPFSFKLKLDLEKKGK